MSQRHRLSILMSICSLSLLLALLLSACGNNSSSGSTPANTNQGQNLKNVSIGLGYIPDIQFAPFYVAKSKGYYSAAGLNVTFHHGVVTDLIGSMTAGKNDFVFAGGDELLQARDKGVKAIDVATIFQKYPVSLIVPADSGIRTLQDLKGHSVGVPGPYGSTYTGLLALLYKAGLSLSDIKLQSIGYTQVAALVGHRVDAVMGYSNNEPLQLRNKGFTVRTFEVSNYQPLVSNGIVTTEDTFHGLSAEVRDFVQATLKGVKDVLANPSEAVDISKSYVPGMDVQQAKNVLQATLPIYQGTQSPGYNDSASWQSMAQFLAAQKMIAPVQDLSQAYTNQAVS